MAEQIYDARLDILREIAAVLTDLADVEEGDEEYEDLAAAMMDAADIMLEALGLEVQSVDENGVITATLELPSEEAD